MTEVKLSPSQQEVLDEFPVFLMDDSATELVITGFAGAGKSFLTRYLAQAAEDQQTLVRALRPEVPRRVLWFSATTNKAANVLKNMVGQQASTIHNLLGLVVDTNYKTGLQTLKQKAKPENLNHSIVFIDEASMIDYQLLQTIRKMRANYKDCKMVFIGDSYQLPPVFEAFSPVFRPNKRNNIFELKEVQRQAEDNPVLQLSAQYRAVIDDPSLNWPEITGDGEHIIVHQDNQSYLEAIKNAFTQSHDVNDYRVLAWENQRVREYNAWIRNFLGMPEFYQPGEMVLTNKPLMAQNRAILAQTDTIHKVTRSADIQKIKDVEGYYVNVENISQGFFQPRNWGHANWLFKKLAVEANKKNDWTEYYRLKNAWADFRPVHSTTVHKAQGSTFREVFVDMGNIGKNTKWHEAARLAYVAISRASHRVHILGNLKPRSNKRSIQPPMEAFDNVANLI